MNFVTYLLSVWKPVVDVVYDNPLAICDGSTILKSDLVAADHITRRHFDINCFGLYSPRYRWWYLNRQRKDEAILFKNFDSEQTVRAKCRWYFGFVSSPLTDKRTGCLHTSFTQHLPDSESKPGRKSIEVRALVFS
jgi:hypothetical protein